MVKTQGGDGKFVPESLRSLSLKEFMVQKTTRTHLGNLVNVEEGEEKVVEKKEKTEFE